MFNPQKQPGRVVWSASLEPIETEHLYRYKLDVCHSADTAAGDEATALRVILEECQKVGAEARCVMRAIEPTEGMKATYHGIGRLREPVGARGMVGEGVAHG